MTACALRIPIPPSAPLPCPGRSWSFWSRWPSFCGRSLVNFEVGSPELAQFTGWLRERLPPSSVSDISGMGAIAETFLQRLSPAAGPDWNPVLTAVPPD